MKRFLPLPTVTATSLFRGRHTCLQRIPAGSTNSFPGSTLFKEKVSRFTGNQAVSVSSCKMVVYRPRTRTNYSWNSGFYCIIKCTNLEVLYPAAEEVKDAGTTAIVQGCNGTLHAAINILPVAVLDLRYSVVLYPGDLAFFTTLRNENSHTWFPGTGLKATPIYNPVATPTVNTRYLVQALSVAGGTLYGSVNVLVHANSVLALQNAFMQGSGMGHQLKIMRQGLASLNYLRIFNRWGSFVFEAKKICGKGPSTINSAEQLTDVCIYKVEATPLPIAVLPIREPSFSFDNPSSTH